MEKKGGYIMNERIRGWFIVFGIFLVVSGTLMEAQRYFNTKELENCIAQARAVHQEYEYEIVNPVTRAYSFRAH